MPASALHLWLKLLLTAPTGVNDAVSYLVRRV
jgi:hypothetical protein